MTIILGIDPGLCITGYGLIKNKNKHLKYLASGCIKTKSTYSLCQRLKIIYQEITRVISLYYPDLFIIEKIFVYKNVSSALKLGESRGAAISAAANKNLSIFEYGPSQIKKTVSGSGVSKKYQIKNLVVKILKLKNVLTLDESDALAIAIAHCYLTDESLTVKVF